MNVYKKNAKYMAVSKKEIFIFSNCSQLEEKTGIPLKQKKLIELIEKNMFVRTLQGDFYFDYAL